MSDLATLQHNAAYSPRHLNTASTASASTSTSTSTSPPSRYGSINSAHSSPSLLPSARPHPHSSSIPDLLAPHANGKRRARRLSTPTEERKEQRKKKKDNRAHNGAAVHEQQPTSGCDDPQLRITTDIDADEHQWLLASVAASQRTAAQLTSEAQHPLLIDPHQLIASSEDDTTPLLTASPTQHPPSHPHTRPDLIAGYEQLSHIRFPPRLSALAVCRCVWAAVGLLEVGWVRGGVGVGGDGNVGGMAGVRVGVVRCWQACWLVLCLCALVWSVAVEWSYDVSVPLLDRTLLAVCWCVSVVAAVLLSHRILSQRLIGTRLYHLYHNAYPSRSSLPAINRTLYSSLVGLLLLFTVGLCADFIGCSPLPAVSVSLMDDVTAASVQSSLWYACVCLLRLQLAAGASLAVCLLDVHRLRVEQSRAVMMDGARCTADDEDTICAHLLDVQLCVADASNRVGVHVAAIIGASALSAVVIALSAVAGGEGVPLASLLCPLLLASYILVAAARLNQSCSRLQSAVSVIALQPPAPAPASAAASAMKPISALSTDECDNCATLPRSSSAGSVRAVAGGGFGASLRSFCWHRVSFDACGVSVDASVVCVFMVVWCVGLLWLMQTEHVR